MEHPEARPGLDLFQPPPALPDLAAETAGLLHQAGVVVAVAEVGERGQVAILLQETPDGRASLTEQRTYRTAEDLALGLHVSRAKVEAFGALSAMVAAEAAADLIDTYEGGWGLVVMVGNASEPGGVQSTSGAAEGFVALGAPSVTILEQCHAEDVARTALKLLGQQAQQRLKHL